MEQDALSEMIHTEGCVRMFASLVLCRGSAVNVLLFKRTVMRGPCRSLIWTFGLCLLENEGPLVEVCSWCV